MGGDEDRVRKPLKTLRRREGERERERERESARDVDRKDEEDFLFIHKVKNWCGKNCKRKKINSIKKT